MCRGFKRRRDNFTSLYRTDTVSDRPRAGARLRITQAALSGQVVCNRIGTVLLGFPVRQMPLEAEAPPIRY